MRQSSVAAALFGLILNAGCGDSGTVGGDAGGGSGDGGGGVADMGVVGYPVWSASSPAVCGQTPYTWLPATSVGTVLESSTKLTLLSLFVKTLNGVAFLGSQLNVHHSLNNDVGRAVIRYQTQDRGKLVDATAMVTWPTSGAKNVPLLLFLHPTLGYTDGCAPSARAGDITAPMTILSLLFASAGYVTVFPDYLNQRSLGAPSTDVTPYLLMEPTAIASLDAARAAQKFLVSKGSTTASSDLYVWGHSQGAQAVEFVTALQPLYAPEYSVKGVAAVSPPSDVAASAKLNFAGPAPTFGLGEAVAYTWSSYYDPTALSTGLIDPWIGRAPGELQNYCTSGYVDPLTKVTDPTTVFAQPFTSVFTQGGKSEPWSCWLHYNNPPTMGPPMNVSVPMLYVTGEQDTTVFPTANDPVAAKWCSQGMQIQYLKCSATDHMHSITNSIDDVLSFFDNRVAGKPLPTALCQNTPAVKCASTP